MFNEQALEELFLKVIKDLHDFLPCLVLVGGCVPYVYAKYVWEDVPGLAVTTSDIDFGVMQKEHRNKETIASRVKKLAYGERHVSMDRLTPFVPLVKSEKGNAQAEVEFIIDSKCSKDIKDSLIGKEIKVNENECFDVVLSSITQITIGEQVVQVPTEPIFTFHKLLTFVRRLNPEKLRKDLYYVYYMLRLSPEKYKLIDDIKILINDRKEGENVVANIHKYFSDSDSEGPVLIEQENGPDYFIDNVREDAYKRIAQLLGEP